MRVLQVGEMVEYSKLGHLRSNFSKVTININHVIDTITCGRIMYHTTKLSNSLGILDVRKEGEKGRRQRKSGRD